MDDISVIDDIREELQNWVNNDDEELSFDPQRLPDAFFDVAIQFFKVSNRLSFQRLKTVVRKMIN